MRRSGPLLVSEAKSSVDSITMMAIPIATGSQALIQYPRPRFPLLDMIVGRLPGDDHVVDVTLAQAGAGDAHKLGFLLQFRDAAATQIAHAGAQAADELEDHGLQRSAVGDTALDSLGDKFGQTVLAGAFALDYAFAA